MKLFSTFYLKQQGSPNKENHPHGSKELQNSETRKPFIIFSNDPHLKIEKVREKNRGELSGEVIHTESHCPNSNP